MLSSKTLAIAASTLLTLVWSAPTHSARQTYTPGTQNNTQEFYIILDVTSPIDSPLVKYNGYRLEAYHTGAGLADPVFVPPPEDSTSYPGTPAYLNTTGNYLQFDTGPYPFSANALPSDTNYARWEPVIIASGYGGGDWTIVDDGYGGEELKAQDVESDGWLVCEWYHGDNLPQLFQLITGFDGSTSAGGVGALPSSCARVSLGVEYF